MVGVRMEIEGNAAEVFRVFVAQIPIKKPENGDTIISVKPGKQRRCGGAIQRISDPRLFAQTDL